MRNMKQSLSYPNALSVVTSESARFSINAPVQKIDGQPVYGKVPNIPKHGKKAQSGFCERKQPRHGSSS